MKEAGIGYGSINHPVDETLYVDLLELSAIHVLLVVEKKEILSLKE